MQTWTYPARIERHDAGVEGDTYLVTFDELPEALTEGASLQAAQVEAADALAAAVAAYLDRGLAVPSPRAAGAGEYDIALEPALAARAALASIMAEQHITKVALAARMGRDEKTIRRLFNPKGASLDLVLAALRAVGASPVLSL